MKLKLLLTLAFVFFSLSLLAQQPEEISITTYYPSPSGAYRDLETQTLRATPATRADINARFGITDGVPNPNRAGLIYYDSADNQMYLFNGTNWVELGGGTVSVGFDVGGYHQSAASIVVDGRSAETIYLLNSVMLTATGADLTALLKYGPYPRVSLYNWHGTGTAVSINFQNFPRGNYSFNWGVDNSGGVDIDQYIVITRVQKYIGGSPFDLPIGDEYNEVVAQARETISPAPLAVSLYLVWCGTGNIDVAGPLYDTDTVNRATNWVNTDPPVYETYSSDELGRSRAKTFNRSSSASPTWRNFGIKVTKRAGSSGKTIKLSVTLNTTPPETNKYRVTYDTQLAVRLRDLQLVLHREGG